MTDAPCLCIYIFTFFFWGLSRLSKCLKRCFLTFPLPPIVLLLSIYIHGMS